MSEAYLKEWVRKAEEDYTAATALVRRRKNPTPGAVSFHCQQCAEKYLKAFLVQGGVIFPKTHDLLDLHKRCVTINADFEQIAHLLDLLNPYSVAYRYPGEVATVAESQAAVKAMKAVRRFVRGVLNLGAQ